jgi:hypothetical protein
MALRDNHTPLRRAITASFDDSELRSLCSDLGVDYDDLPRDGKAHKAHDLIDYLGRRGSVDDLIKRCAALRPHLTWDSLSSKPTIEERVMKLEKKMDALQSRVDGLAVRVQKRDGPGKLEKALTQLVTEVREMKAQQGQLMAAIEQRA